MEKIAVILYGPPGSGKGTQANILAHKLNLIHFDTGRFLEDLVNDPERQHEKTIKREKDLFDKGILMTPSFVLKEVSNKVRKLRKAGWGIIFSGSPRTMYETKALLPILNKLYGKKNIYIFILNIPPESSIDRNGHRLICSVCGHMVLAAYHPLAVAKHCPVCAGPLYRRTLDRPDVIKVRLEEYKNRTMPIFEFLKKQGYHLKTIDARPAPYKVLKKIYAHLKAA